jgi:nitrogen regulatory protein P-II 1
MNNQPMTYLTDAVLITAVVPAGHADAILKVIRDAGVTGGIVHMARGTGPRERVGLIGIAIEAEKEVLSVIVPADQQDFIAEAIFNAGDLGVPGNGYLYLSPLDRVATYIPDEARARMGKGQP